MIPAFALLHEVEGALSIPDVIQQYAEFIAYFLALGALGFRFFVLERVQNALPGESRVLHEAEHRAALIGALGAVLLLVTFVTALADTASDSGVTLLTALTTSKPASLVTLVVGIVWLIAFPVARGRMRAAWMLAALAAVVLVFQSITSGKWSSLINPIHRASASLWLGTLLVVVAAGMSAIFKADLTRERRNALAAQLISRFSPLALTAATTLAITGLITAYLHLKYVAAIWTTSYGIALDVKLFFVAIIVALGAINWKRMTPQIGNEEGARAIDRSARKELIVAAIVLAITAVLVSLPTPRLPKPAPPAVATAQLP